MKRSSSHHASSTRRSFLIATTGAAVAAVSPGRVEAGEAVEIQRASNQDLMRVRIEMTVKGNVNVPGDPLVSRQSKVTMPIQSDAVFDYEERYRRPQGADPHSVVTAIERFYHEAHSTSRVNRTDKKLQLRESVKQAQVRRDSLPETVYAVEDYFTNEETQLLRVPVSSAAIDELLPSNAVSVGDTFQPESDSLASVLNLSSIQANEVQAEVTGIDAGTIKFQLKGKVLGAVEGVPTTIELIGKLNFDRKIGCCNWLAIAVHEIREIGKAEPGFDVSATIKMVRQPLPRTVGLPATPAKMAIETAIPEDRLYVDLRSERVGVSAVMDRRWRMMSDLTGSSVMRMIDNDRSIAQCNLKSLASLAPGKQWTLEAFQADVRQTIGKDLTQLIEADQRVSATGLRVLRVVAHGDVEGVPIQWVMLHFSDDSGRRVSATFTMSGDMINSFAGADLQLADSLRLLDSETMENNRPEAVAEEVAAANGGNQSPSDSDKVQSKR